MSCLAKFKSFYVSIWIDCLAEQCLVSIICKHIHTSYIYSLHSILTGLYMRLSYMRSMSYAHIHSIRQVCSGYKLFYIHLRMHIIMVALILNEKFYIYIGRIMFMTNTIICLPISVQFSII